MSNRQEEEYGTSGKPPRGREVSRAIRLRWLSSALGVLLLAAAVFVLHGELHGIRYREIRATLTALPRSALALSVLLCALNYAVLTGFDILAFRYIGRAVAAWKIALVSFTGYAISNSVGFALISGTSVRYRFYSRWGLRAAEISRVVVFYTGTFWVGIFVMGGASLAFDPHPNLVQLPGSSAFRALGWVLLAVAAAYAVACARSGGAPLRVRGIEIALPPLRVALGQFVLSSLDWALAAGIFYVLLPKTALTFSEFLSAFLVAQLLGLVSHVPGGAGVFDGAMVVMLRTFLTPEQILSSLVLYRIVYYVIPLAAALGVLTVDEVRIRRQLLARRGSAFGALTAELAPKVLAIFVFLAGVVLLVSGAAPADRGDLARIGRTLPLPVLEVAQVAASVVGVALLVASHGVARRLRGAFPVAAGLLIAGVAASLLRGDWGWEAALLAALLLVLLPSRSAFDRRVSFWQARFSPEWIVGAVLVVGVSIWLGAYSFRNLYVTTAPWSHFALWHEATRFLRASLAAVIALVVFLVARLMRPAHPVTHLPTERERVAARRIGEARGVPVPENAMILLNPGRTAFLPYRVRDRLWLALGDPVGTDGDAAWLAREFMERCEDFDGVPIFYGIHCERRPLYMDFGLTIGRLRAAGAGEAESIYLAYPGGLDLGHLAPELSALTGAPPATFFTVE